MCGFSLFLLFASQSLSFRKEEDMPVLLKYNILFWFGNLAKANHGKNVLEV